MKITFILLFLSLTGCCTNNTMDIQVQLRDMINVCQTRASEAYQVGLKEKYEYWRGKADGVADARDLFEARK